MDMIRAIAICLFVSVCHAQTDAEQVAWHKKYDGKLSVQAFVLNTSNTFALRYGGENLDIDLEPNKKTTLGLSVQYEIIAFSLGFAPSFFADNKDNGNSKMTSFGLDLFPGRFVQRLDYYCQKGISLNMGGESIYLENLKTMKIGGSTAFIFNRRFSYRSIGLQNAKQLKSAGTFAPALSYFYTEVNGRSQEGMGEKGYFLNVALTPTYYYNWVIAKDFMLSAGFGLGAGATFPEDGDPKLLSQASALIGLGYNSERFFAGVNSRAMASNQQASGNVAMDDTINYATAFVGYRFDAPKFLVKGKEKIEERLK